MLSRRRPGEPKVAFWPPTWPLPRASQKASIKAFNAFGRSPGTKKLPRAAQNPSRTPIWTSRHQFGTPFRCNFNRFSTAFDHPFRYFLCFPASPHEACQSNLNPSRPHIWTSRQRFETHFRCNVQSVLNRCWTSFSFIFVSPASPDEACRNNLVS